MKALLAAVLAFLVAAPAVVAPAVVAPAWAEDCVLDHCADRQPLPQAQQAPGGGSGAGDRFGPEAWRGGPAKGDFDFYVLALSWSPSFCETTGARRGSAQCAPGAHPGFVVHGLWPQNDDGYPSQCPGDPSLPYSVLSRLSDLYADSGLARHEWRQHGLCSAKTPAGYFADVRAARNSVVVPPASRRPGGPEARAARYPARFHGRQSAPARRHDGGDLPARPVS